MGEQNKAFIFRKSSPSFDHNDVYKLHKNITFQNYVSHEDRTFDLDNLLLHALNRTVTLAVDRAEAETEADTLDKNKFVISQKSQYVTMVT